MSSELPLGRCLEEAAARALPRRYGIDREIARGGMATVYRGYDYRHDRQVALKILRPEVAAELGDRMFRQEIRITAGLVHPGIVPLFDSGCSAGLWYYVMPYLPGDTLRERLRRQPKLTLDLALSVTRDVGNALDHAHACRVVHRDVKPANILLCGDRAVITDFGIASIGGSTACSTAGRRCDPLGSPGYMSPEQVEGHAHVGPRSDLYSLACVLYRMLCGRSPYGRGSGRAVALRCLTQDPRPVSDFRPELAPSVGEIVARALARDPADRYGSAEELIRDLCGYTSNSTKEPERNENFIRPGMLF